MIYHKLSLFWIKDWCERTTYCPLQHKGEVKSKCQVDMHNSGSMLGRRGSESSANVSSACGELCLKYLKNFQGTGTLVCPERTGWTISRTDCEDWMKSACVCNVFPRVSIATSSSRPVIEERLTENCRKRPCCVRLREELLGANVIVVEQWQKNLPSVSKKNQIFCKYYKVYGSPKTVYWLTDLIN